MTKQLLAAHLVVSTRWIELRQHRGLPHACRRNQPLPHLRSRGLATRAIPRTRRRQLILRLVSPQVTANGSPLRHLRLASHFSRLFALIRTSSLHIRRQLSYRGAEIRTRVLTLPPASP